MTTQTTYLDPIDKGQGTNNLKKRADKIEARIQMNRIGKKFLFQFEMDIDSTSLLNF